ncbi:hypothetical protein LCGC14_1224540 [marine sediment metagenome]|uniref:Uncharacterized protein n=1 Tax=marine sediment metagenome TaxID=412755 RepID=A0A0F9NSM5_9ZZZZ
MIIMERYNKNINNPIKQFIDFDKNNKIFYISYYFDETKLVLKNAIVLDGTQDVDIKIENFNLAKYIYLTQID